MRPKSVIVGVEMKVPGSLEVYLASTHPIARGLLYAQMSFTNIRHLDVLSTKRFFNIAGGSTGIVRQVAPLL